MRSLFFRMGNGVAAAALAMFIASSIGIDANTADAQPKLSGELNYEDTSVRGRDPYTVAQERSLAFVHSLEDSLESTPQITPVEAPELQYLAAAYLYCSINKGTCPFILDAVLESDVIRSKQHGTIECPTMTGFWKAWVNNDMENRHKYSVRTSFLHETEEFRAKERPRYLKCKETVAKILEGSGSAADFFAKRYAVPSDIATAIVTTSRYLEGLPTVAPNVLAAVGIESPKEDARPATEKAAPSSRRKELKSRR